MKKETKKILTSYLHGDVSPDLAKKAKDYIVEYRNDDALNDFLAEEWLQTPDDNELRINEEENWIELKKYMEQSDKPKVMVFFSRRMVNISLAAAIALLVVMTFLFQSEFQKSDKDTQLVSGAEYVIKQTDKGEKLNVSLPDGSTIRLNSSSRLRIPSNYGTAADRVVLLDGEAFFNVSKFENKPFKVFSKGVETKVLGTSFNINSKDNQGNVSVAVITGKVQVSTKRSKILLNPEESTVVSLESINLKKRHFDTDEITAWYRNVLVFDENKFDEVIRILEEWYGVKFDIQGSPKVGEKYTGRFENSSLQIVLEGLGFSSSFDYEINNETVFIKFK